MVIWTVLRYALVYITDLLLMFIRNIYYVSATIKQIALTQIIYQNQREENSF